MQKKKEVTKETVREWLDRDVRMAIGTLSVILASEAYLDMLAEKLFDDYLRIESQKAEASRNGN